MHEFHEGKLIAETAVKLCEERGHSRVTEIHLTIGEAATYSPEVVTNYFNECAQGTCAEGAQIVVKSVPACLRCPQCGEVFERKPLKYNCPKCGAEANPCKIGTEMEIGEIKTV